MLEKRVSKVVGEDAVEDSSPATNVEAAGRGSDPSGHLDYNRSYPSSIEMLEKRVSKVVSEDTVEDSSPATKKRPVPRLQKPSIGPGADPPAAEQAESIPEDENQELLLAVVDEVRRMKKEHIEVQTKVAKLATELQQASAADAAGDARGAADEDCGNVKVAQRAEAAADAAKASAESASRFRDELEQILRAVEVPSADAYLDKADGLLGDGFVQTAHCCIDEDEEPNEEPNEELVQGFREHTERQQAMEDRLNQLQEQLEQASIAAPESEIFTGMKGVVKDVRSCLSRCELLVQLPEIKAFIKRFQRSLELNAILQAKWLGPKQPDGGGKEDGADMAESGQGSPAPPQGRAAEEQLPRGIEHSRSTPELTEKTRRRRG